MVPRYNPYEIGTPTEKIQRKQTKFVRNLAEMTPAGMLGKGVAAGVTGIKDVVTSRQAGYAELADKKRRKQLGLPAGTVTGRQAGIAFANEPMINQADPPAPMSTLSGKGTTSTGSPSVASDKRTSSNQDMMFTGEEDVNGNFIQVPDSREVMPWSGVSREEQGRKLSQAITKAPTEETGRFSSNGLSVIPKDVGGESVFTEASPEARKNLLVGLSDRDTFVPGRESTQQAGYRAREDRFASNVRGLSKARANQRKAPSSTRTLAQMPDFYRGNSRANKAVQKSKEAKWMMDRGKGQDALALAQLSGDVDMTQTGLREAGASSRAAMAGDTQQAIQLGKNQMAMADVLGRTASAEALEKGRMTRAERAESEKTKRAKTKSYADYFTKFKTDPTKIGTVPMSAQAYEAAMNPVPSDTTAVTDNLFSKYDTQFNITR